MNKTYRFDMECHVDVDDLRFSPPNKNQLNSSLTLISTTGKISIVEEKKTGTNSCSVTFCAGFKFFHCTDVKLRTLIIMSFSSLYLSYLLLKFMSFFPQSQMQTIRKTIRLGNNGTSCDSFSFISIEIRLSN